MQRAELSETLCVFSVGSGYVSHLFTARGVAEAWHGCETERQGKAAKWSSFRHMVQSVDHLYYCRDV